MHVFGIGLPEVILILVVAVIVLGPERVPEFAVQLARAIRWLRGYANQSTAELRSEFNDLMKEYEEVRQELRELRGSVDRDTEAVRSDVESLGGDIETTKEELRGATKEMDRTIAETGPIIEPGGDLPPKLRREEEDDEEK